MLPVVVIRLHVGDLHAVGWDEGPTALATPVKAIRVGVGAKKHLELPRFNPTSWSKYHLLSKV